MSLGCGDDSHPPPVDAGAPTPDSGRPDAGPAYEEPAPVRPPALTPCPEGWVPVAVGEAVTCAAYESGPDECPAGHAHRPGEPGCARVGRPCPTIDDFADDVGPDAVFVRPGAGGDGSRASPLSTLDEALAMTGGRGEIALSTGVHVGMLHLRAGDLVLRGACTETVVASGSGRSPVLVSGARLELRDVTLRGGGTALAVDAAAELVASGVVFEDAPGGPLAVSGGSRASLSDALVEGGGEGLSVSFGARLEVSRAAILGVGTPLQVAGAGTEALVSDTLIADAGADLRSLVVALNGGRARFERVVATASRSPFVLADGGGEVSFSQVDWRAASDDLAGSALGLIAFGGSRLTLDRVRLSGMPVVGVAVSDPGTELEASDVVIDEPRLSTPASGHAVEVVDGATATLTRVYVLGAADVGVLVSGAGAAAVVEDLSIVETGPNARLLGGRALQVQRAGSVRGSRVASLGNREAAVVGTGDDTRLVLEDLVVEDTRPRACEDCPGGGIGLAAYERSSVRVSRFRVIGSALTGVQLTNDGQLDLADGLVAGSPVGANVQIPGYDLSRLTTRVAYRDNGTNLDAASLFVPDADVAPSM